jgi:non-specific serine/threonine protein kinase
MWQAMHTSLAPFRTCRTGTTRSWSRCGRGSARQPSRRPSGAGRAVHADAIALALERQPRVQVPEPRADAAEGLGLTKREREVAALIAQGLSNREIAARLVVAQRTAEGHVENILSKLGFTSRTQVAGWLAAQNHT